MNSRAKAIITLIAGITLSFAAVAQTPKFKRGEDYGSIRVKLLQQGWKPLILPDSDECMEDDTRCQGRPEMQWCSGTGLAGCQFNWVKNGKIPPPEVDPSNGYYLWKMGDVDAIRNILLEEKE